MTQLRLLLAAFSVTTVLNAQVTTCHGYNYQSNQSVGVQVVAGTEIGILYQVPGSAPFIADRVQVYLTNGGGGGGGVIPISPTQGTLRLETADPVTGLPSGSVTASGSVGSFSSGGGLGVLGSGWKGFQFPPTPFASSQLVWVIFSVAPFPGPEWLGEDPGGPDVVTSSVNTGGGWGALSVAVRFKLRFRSTNCNPPGQSAIWAPVGYGCASASTGSTPTLTPSAPPALGTSLTLDIGNATAGQMAYVFISSGISSGVPTILPNGCPLWLDLPSFAALAAAGANPLLQGPVAANGVASFPVTIPNDVSLVGAAVGVQAAVDDASIQGFCVTGGQLAAIAW